MTRWTNFLLTTTFLFLGQYTNGQTAKDSATYWVNKKYLACLDSGKSVCYCQEQDNFLILHIDTIAKKLTVAPSIYYSWETFEFDIKRYNKSSFTILPGVGIDRGSTFNIKANQLTLTTLKQTTLFTKIEVQRFDNKSIQGDLWKQIGVINCKPLLKYSIKLCSDSSAFPLTTKRLSEYISTGRITINCSTDYHYNEMYINIDNVEFFLVYKKDSIKLYKEEPRDEDVVVDITTLKDCQLLIKTK